MKLQRMDKRPPICYPTIDEYFADRQKMLKELAAATLGAVLAGTLLTGCDGMASDAQAGSATTPAGTAQAEAPVTAGTPLQPGVERGGDRKAPQPPGADSPAVLPLHPGVQLDGDIAAVLPPPVKAGQTRCGAAKPVTVTPPVEVRTPGKPATVVKPRGESPPPRLQGVMRAPAPPVAKPAAVLGKVRAVAPPRPAAK